jgi:hypothetical protein
MEPTSEEMKELVERYGEYMRKEDAIRIRKQNPTLIIDVIKQRTHFHDSLAYLIAILEKLYKYDDFLSMIKINTIQ